MNGFDFLIAAVIGLSISIGIWRGFVHEALSLGKWILASIIAWIFTEQASGLFSNSISDPTLRLAAAFIFVFIVGYILGTWATAVLHKVFSSRKFLKLTNRILGASFGAARGIVIITLVFMLAGLTTTVPQSQWWRHASFVPFFQSMALFTSEFLPKDIARHIHYD